jgi:hypothetical protein
MGDNIYTSYWKTILPTIINQFKGGRSVIQVEVPYLVNFGDRSTGYYARFKIVKGELQIPRNAYAHGRDLYAVLVKEEYFIEHMMHFSIQVTITKDLLLKMEILPPDTPDFFTEEDFEDLAKYAGQKKDKTDPEHQDAYEDLRNTYAKINYWAKETQKETFSEGSTKIIQKPTNQANKFEHYHWSKIYPDKISEGIKILAFTIAIDAQDGFVIKIDTVGLRDNDKRRMQYFSMRGDYRNSGIIKLIPKGDVLDKGWDYLIDLTNSLLAQLKPDFDNILSSMIGENVNTLPNMENNISKPLNTILFGPPGTGKTHKLKSLIKEMDLIESSDNLTPDYSAFVKEHTWWEILAIILNEKKKASVPELLEHPLVKAKFAMSNVLNTPQSVWSVLQNHTVRTCPNVKNERRFGELLFFKESDSTWRLDNAGNFEKEFPYLSKVWEEFSQERITKAERKHYTFLTCHQSLAYEDFIEGIKPDVDKNEEGEQENILLYVKRKGAFYQACEEAAKKAGFDSLQHALGATPEKRAEVFNKARSENRIHVLFLDEISRCNVSAVFGELITLIEDDKRLGAKNEIADVLLPYSQDLFGVPSNLYIIGTMNTADRSVEALDTALRRRFTFEEMEPRPELLSTKRLVWNLWWDYQHKGWEDEPYKSKEKELYQLLGVPEGFGHDDKLWTPMKKEGRKDQQVDVFNVTSQGSGVDLTKMLTVVNQRLVALLTKDHTIGHAWLMEVGSFKDLQMAFKNKILPLLQEYFFNSYEKIGLVLGKAFVVQHPCKGVFAKDFSGANDLKGDYEEKMIYTLQDPGKLLIDAFRNIYA